MSSKNTVRYKLGERIGPCCPRCGQRTEVREHRKITAQELKRPFYYSRWYYCHNKSCKTSLIMPEEFKVWNEGKQVIEEPRKHQDVVMEVLEELSVDQTKPPWE